MLSVISVFNKKHQWSHQTGLSVFNKDIRGSVVEPDRGEEAAPDGQVGGGVDLAADL